MLRIEAGLLLLDVDFSSSRFAWTDEDRSTPIELGLGWMFKDLATDDRAFIGRRALEREIADKTSRWRLTGLVVDWEDYERIYNEAGLIAPKDHTPDRGGLLRLRRRHQEQVGYATSFMYSPDAPAPHRPGPRATRARDARHRGPPGGRREPPLRVRRRGPPVCRSTTRLERRPDDDDQDDDDQGREGRRQAGRSRREATKATSRADRTYDAIVIGGGHNGLVNGAYLAKAGLKTLIIERRHLVGGAAITEELRPGF